MNNLIELLLGFLLVSDFFFLGTSKLMSFKNLVCFQGLIIGSLPFLTTVDPMNLHVLIIAPLSILIKGIIFPYFIQKTIVSTNINREVEPFIGYNYSLICGIIILLICFWFASKLNIRPSHVSTTMIFPIAAFTMFVGLFLIISRKKAITQAMGYLTFENGIYVLGAGVMNDIPIFVEIGILLDIFVAVFVMKIAIHKIKAEFNHTDTDELDNLIETGM